MDRLTVEYHRLWWGGTTEAYMRIIGGIYEQGLMMKNASIYSVFKVLWRVWHLWHWHFDTKAIGIIFCYGVKVSKCQGVKVIFPWLLLCLYKHTNPLIQVSSIDFPSNLHRLCIEFASALQRRIIGGTMEHYWIQGWISVTRHLVFSNVYEVCPMRFLTMTLFVTDDGRIRGSSS